MLQKILRWTSISLLTFLVLCAVVLAFKKNDKPIENAESIAQRKAKSAVKCTPETNKNCFNLTIAQVKQIQEKKNGLSRKNN